MKYEVRVSEYGTVARLVDIEVEAKTPKEAEERALLIATMQEDLDWEEEECIDGWEHQVESTKEI